MAAKSATTSKIKPAPPKKARASVVAVRTAQNLLPAASDVSIRIVAQKNGVTIRSVALFRDPASEAGRIFLARVFSLPEIAAVEINRKKAEGYLQYRAAAATANVLRKLKEALVPSPPPRQGRRKKSRDSEPLDDSLADALFLKPPEAFPIRVVRVGSHLSTWRVRSQEENKVRLAHPLLRRRKDVAYRLEDELTATLGIRDFQINRLTSSVTVHFNPRCLNVPRLLQHLERAWPRLVKGAEGPPSDTRLLVSAGLLTTAFTAQFFVPALTPYVLVGVAAYGFTNVISAVKMLLRGKVGLPVLYTATLTFTILSGMPFAATLMATFMQFWPRLAFRTLTNSRRRLFATHLQQSTWVRLLSADGVEVEISIDKVKIGDAVVICKGEHIPVDGVIESGLAAIEEEALSGKAGALDKGPGDAVFAATFVKDGQITVRVGKIGNDTVAGFIGTHLPLGRIDHLPATAQAEHVAMNMVAPALALSGLNLLLTGNVLPSQATIRPDYATAPRFSAQLTALHELGDGLRRGILFRHPAALSRLPATDIYVFDDVPALDRRRSQVSEIIAARGISSTEVLSYATSAFPSFQNERARALMEECIRDRAPLREISQRTRCAGAVRYRDEQNRQIEICTAAYIGEQGLKVPRTIAEAVAVSSSAWDWQKKSPRAKGKAAPHAEPPLRPLWVIRDRQVLGVVTFQRKGELEAVEVIATLKARNANARFVHISSRPQAEAEARAEKIGISTVHGGLNAEDKANVLASLGRRTMWIGDGTSPDAFLCVQASMVSISAAGSATLPDDLASVVLLQSSLRGLVPLRRIGRRHRAQLKKTYRAVFAANLFCVAGAFLGGFTTLTVALISNSATGYVYFTQRNWLDDLISRTEAKMAQHLSAEPDDDDPHDGDDDVSIAIDETEPRAEFLDEDLDGPMEDENPI
jgi:cation-transporting P-type ATPase C